LITIRLAGAKSCSSKGPTTLLNAINSNTAMIYTTDLGDKLASEASIAKEHKVPLLLDDARRVFRPIDNIKLYARMKLESLHFFQEGRVSARDRSAAACCWVART